MDGGAITAITAVDGAKWAYEHDANSRLTKAERYDTNGTTLLHRYSYTYDDGDNLLTKAVLDAVASVTTAMAFAYNDANELVSQAVGGTTTSFAYDAWGRMTSKSDGTYSATYAYRYGNKLASVTSDFPSEGSATYQYDGAGKRRQRTAAGSTTRYRWDMSWTVLNEEDAFGDLTRTYVGRSSAHVDGANPSTGTWRFYVHDHLGSTRGVYDADESQYAALEYTPYGEVYASNGSTSDITRRYTGHDWDDAAELYYAPYRYYAPGLARWISRDPQGMVDGPNVYGYVGVNPIMHMDLLGTTLMDLVRQLFEDLLDILCGIIPGCSAAKKVSDITSKGDDSGIVPGKDIYERGRDGINDMSDDDFLDYMQNGGRTSDIGRCVEMVGHIVPEMDIPILDYPAELGRPSREHWTTEDDCCE